MDEETVYEFGLGIVVIFSIFNYLYSGATFFTTLIAIVAIVGVILLLKGLVQYLFTSNKDNIWAGIILIMILVMLFGGLPVVLDALRLVLAVALAILDSGISYLVSVV